MPSRRLGRSLGIDLIPHKVCTLNCVYCQCGATTLKTLQQRAYVPYQQVIDQVQRVLRKQQPIDFLTLSGSGEPTLNSEIGRLIIKLKKITNIPICVITNSSLLYRADVRRALHQADVVLPTLCTTSQRIFDRIHRPHPRLKITNIIQGLAAFRKEFKGQIWLEVMLVRGLNDSPRRIRGLKKAIARIKPDKIQLNTVIRPPSESTAQPVHPGILKRIQAMLGPRCEIVAEFSVPPQTALSTGLEQAILGIIRRRPETADAIAGSLGANRTEVMKILYILHKRKRVRIVTHHKHVYYKLKPD